jgi:hypothetical protein
VMTVDKVREDVRYLYGVLSAREGKYVRNLNRYNNNGVRRESLWTPNVAPQAYVTPAQGVDGTQTQINLIKSCVDSVASRISQANVRPFFNPINGTYDTTEACKTAQHFFDIWLDENHAYPKSVMCFRDAAVYDIGVMYVNPLTKGLARVAPWEYFIDPAEYYHGAVSRVMHLSKNVPIAKVMSFTDSKDIQKLFDQNPHQQGEYATYYDLYKGEVWQFYDHYQLKEPEKLDFEQYGGLYRRPFVEMYYTKPMKGFYSVSLADDIYPIQRQVDELVRRLDNATRKAVLNMILVPNGSGLKASSLENGVTAYNYNPGADGGKVDVITPPAINGQFVDLLNLYMDKAYQIAGISQLSAQSRKPAGLNSGKALQTMEDIESDRFNTQLQQFTHFLVDVARVAIDCFPGKDRILPNDIGRGKLTWGDLRKQRDLFSLQFSAASSLSKDPGEKRGEIQFLIDAGLIDKSTVAKFYQMPDLEGVYTLASSSSLYCDRVINNAIKDGNVDFSETIDLDDLKTKALGKLNQLNASGDDSVYINRLQDLLYRIMDAEKHIGAVEQGPPPPTPPPPSTTALDSGQIQALTALASSPLDPAKARAIAGLAFPQADPQALDSIFTSPAPMVQNGPQAPMPMAPPIGGMQ